MNKVDSFMLGGIFGILFSSALVYAANSGERNAIEECEKSLPRDQVCEVVIMAKVKEK